MKNHFTTFMIVPLLSITCLVQGHAEESQSATTDSLATLKAAYALCGQYGDAVAAAPLAYQLAVVDTAETVKWKEELAKIHFATNRLAICVKILEDLTVNHKGGEKLAILEMTALCHEGLGHKEQASYVWEILWGKSASAVHAVRYAGILYESGQLDKADGIIKAGLAAEDSQKKSIPLPRTSEEMQQIPAAAALHNLKGLVTLKRDPAAKDAARAEFEAALKMAPDYEIAKRNLGNL